jgi:phosphoribosylaminoimidazole-succinocarboxamide synthase
MQPLLETNLPLRLFRRGKVRDTYELDGSLLMVATDRISAFDVVLPDGIPEKGAVLTQLSLFWFARMKHIVDNHVLSSDAPSSFPGSEKYAEALSRRSMVVKKAQPIPFECVVRGYLAGSAWKEYKATQSVCGLALPAGLKESAQLPEPVFTPATKAESGHDVNVSFGDMEGALGMETASVLREKSIEIYLEASDYAARRGIIIADTKMEFGFCNDGIILIDELLTPDSSRFWPADGYAPGRTQRSFDKQYVRDYLESTGWDKRPPAPRLPAEVVANTSRKYIEAYERIIGNKWS